MSIKYKFADEQQDSLIYYFTTYIKYEHSTTLFMSAWSGSSCPKDLPNTFLGHSQEMGQTDTRDLNGTRFLSCYSCRL